MYIQRKLDHREKPFAKHYIQQQHQQKELETNFTSYFLRQVESMEMHQHQIHENLSIQYRTR
ncbi:hypothetical protein BLOT_015402 [Blomia tropicalis]|nr:hypothetical protein BLOT_015402 [Blomia tropicalis]